ncbi:MAG: ribosome-associated translation inhibitor RaiA [Acidimicrobiia bacterium]|nr:ribosome-associated translation inhibitor RaiA [Acidimicrobiia bacterium]MBT8249618.1 ribosome-associated translation inhibitor RaiA [Acidimicrobiia bacterium]NNC42588.1 ribosome-associated translation inhibitor RaiA [Acidimicrobiia bacterium]NNL27791.1 ribosome-associated translation inhibitor RaiA [Acidimicrobiia bacterium]
MDVNIHGRHLNLSDGLREMAEGKIEAATRFFEGKVVKVDVEFSEEPNPRQVESRHQCEITANVAQHLVRVESQSSDRTAAFDDAVDRFERQLRKLKERLIQRHRTDDHKRLNAEGFEDDDSEDTDDVQIERVKQFILKPMTPQEAVLQMELLGHAFFFFLNAETDQHAVVYWRKNKSVGLIEAS